MQAMRRYIHDMDQVELFGGRCNRCGVSRRLGGRMQRRALHARVMRGRIARVAIMVHEVMPAMAHHAEQQRGEKHERAKGARGWPNPMWAGHHGEEHCTPAALTTTPDCPRDRNAIQRLAGGASPNS